MATESRRKPAGGQSRLLGVGELAPPFELRKTFEENVSLEGLVSRGPVLIAFYVFDFGNIWSHELAQLGSLTPELRTLGAEPVAIAVTATFSQMAFADALGIDFPLLSDWDGDVAHAYGVQYDVWKGHRGLAKRSVFVVDVNREVKHVWVSDDALIQPDFEDAMTVIRQLSR